MGLLLRLCCSNMRYLKPVIFIICLIPLALVVWDGFHDALGANPIETLSHRTGEWTLRFLLITLAITPIRRLFGWTWTRRFRRMLGLYAFFYACLHFLTWLVLDQFFDWDEIIKDIIKRPYITVGFSAFILLIPLAVTSTKGMMRRLGHRWGRLHRLIYVIAVLGAIHYLWLVKADNQQPLIYAAVLIVLLGLRAWWWRTAKNP